MIEFMSLVKRNFKCYIRDGGAVFFSLLSAIILLTLYLLFLGNIVVGDLGDYISDNKVIDYLKYSQMLAGVLVINSVSLSFGGCLTMVRDSESRVMDSFLVTPVNRLNITLSYFTTAIIYSVAINSLLWSVGIIGVGFLTGHWYAWDTILIVFSIIILNALISTSIMILLVSFIKSMSLFGALNGVLGTFIAFISGVYLPYSEMPKAVEIVGSALPFTHMTIWLKQIMLRDPLAITGFPSDVTEMIKDGFSANNIGLFTLDVPLWGMMLLAGGIAIICIVLAVLKIQKRLSQR